MNKERERKKNKKSMTGDIIRLKVIHIIKESKYNDYLYLSMRVNNHTSPSINTYIKITNQCD